jgi:hypothetical protein
LRPYCAPDCRNEAQGDQYRRALRHAA